MIRTDIYECIEHERREQHAKWDRSHDWGYGDCSSLAVDDSTKVMVLTEECGEVARAVLELDADATRRELVQVAAVAVAWLEAL